MLIYFQNKFKGYKHHQIFKGAMTFRYKKRHIVVIYHLFCKIFLYFTHL